MKLPLGDLMESVQLCILKMSIRYVYEPTAKGASLTKTTEYEIPYSILGKIIDKMRVRKDMEKADEKGLMDLKKALET